MGCKSVENGWKSAAECRHRLYFPRKPQHNCYMAVPPNHSLSKQRAPSRSSLGDSSGNDVIDETQATGSLRYVLPKDLDAAIKRLDDQQLERLALAVLEERTQRKRLSSPGNQQQRLKAESPTSSLPQGKLNAVRAAFKAGVTPARIAREFGLSHADVRNALSGHGSKL